MRHTATRLILTVFLIALLLVTSACSKLTTANYKKLEVGMPYDDVISIFGKTDNCTSAIGLKSCTWGDDKTYVTVQFMGDQVILFSSQGL